MKVPHRFLFTNKAVQGEEHAKAVMSLGRLDAPASDDGETTRGSLLSSGEEGVDDKLDGMRRGYRLRSAIEAFVGTLDARKADIIRRRYLTDEAEALEDIGKTHGISKQRVKQLEAETVFALREFLKSCGVPAADVVGVET